MFLFFLNILYKFKNSFILDFLNFNTKINIIKKYDIIKIFDGFLRKIVISGNEEIDFIYLSSNKVIRLLTLLTHFIFIKISQKLIYPNSKQIGINGNIKIFKNNENTGIV